MINRKLLPVIGLGIFVAVWYAIVAFHLLNTLFVPPPHAVAGTLIEMLASGDIVDDVLVTLYRTFAGYAIAGAIGIPIGLILGYSTVAKGLFTLPMEVGRATPAAAIFPLFLLLGGTSDASRLMMVVFGCSFVVIINSLYGVQNASRARVMYAQSLGGTNTKIFSKITFWDALPYIFVGLRLSLNIALILVVFSEMFIGTDIGLGYVIYNSNLRFHIEEMYAAILMTGLIGYFANLGFVRFEKRIVHWAGK